MGSFEGHALPGSFFIIFGVWWSMSMYYRKYMADLKQERFTSSSNFHCLFLCGPARNWPIEGGVKIFFVLVGGIIEIVHGYDHEGNFTDMDNAQHATMFLFFGINGIIDVLFYFRVSLPRGLDYASLSMALMVEYILFKTHIAGRSFIDNLVHTLLLYIVLASAVILIVEMAFPRNMLIALARAFLFIFQGTWFWQIGFIVYNPIVGSKPWNSDNHQHVMLATMYFTWHIGVILLFMLIIGGVVKFYISHRCRPNAKIPRNIRASTNTDYVQLAQLEVSGNDAEVKNLTANIDDSCESSLNSNGGP